MMTTTETVRCIIPLSDAAAPKNAYVPGVIHGTSGSQAAKKLELGNDSCKAFTRIPTIRPKDAPTAIEGTNIPAGTLQPYEKMTSMMRRTVAMNRDNTIGQRFCALYGQQISTNTSKQSLGVLLANSHVIVVALALPEQNFHHLCHIDPEKDVGIAQQRCHTGQKNSFCNGIRGQVFLPKGLYSQIPFDDQGAIQATENSDNDEKYQFKKVPCSVVFDLEHDKLPGPKGVHGLYNDQS
jgi:hypothetical protein